MEPNAWARSRAAYLTYLRNAQGIQDTGKTLALAFFEVNQQFAGNERPHALQSQKLFFRQFIEVGDITGESGRDQLVYDSFAHALDVHGVLGAPMQQAFPHLGRARGVHALGGGLVFDAHELRAAYGTGGRHDEETLDAGAGREHRAEDLGDDRAGLAHDDRVSDEDAKTFDLVLVVQGRPCNDRPVDLHRREYRDRGCDARSTDGDDDVLEARLLFFGRELPGGGPSWFFGCLAQCALQRYLVHLEHDAVGSKRQRTAGSRDLPGGSPHLGGCTHQADEGRHSEADAGNPVQQTLLGRQHQVV